ncbi:cyclic nucleotide-gated ion channel 1-like [Abeliophyllum distichum]|uniref:Cyclic nucleotide-gated ion channel 1-like n=1 Tax=Abeliophyllum distichum TaxID=126358 RepID=A0ABD1VXT9_9LAMI
MRCEDRRRSPRLVINGEALHGLCLIGYWTMKVLDITVMGQRPRRNSRGPLGDVWTLTYHGGNMPIFEKMDEQLLDAICHRLKSVVYVKDSFTVMEGDLVDAMLFIIRGKLLSVTSNG